MNIRNSQNSRNALPPYQAVCRLQLYAIPMLLYCIIALYLSPNVVGSYFPEFSIYAVWFSRPCWYPSPVWCHFLLSIYFFTLLSLYGRRIYLHFLCWWNYHVQLRIVWWSYIYCSLFVFASFYYYLIYLITTFSVLLRFLCSSLLWQFANHSPSYSCPSYRWLIWIRELSSQSQNYIIIAQNQCVIVLSIKYGLHRK